MKPDWDVAPEWAMYFTIDETGIATWHEIKPERHSLGWHSEGKMQSIVDKWYWRTESLEPRP